MKTYTKEQLVKAMALYYQEAIDKPEQFLAIDELPVQKNAEKTISYLLELADSL